MNWENDALIKEVIDTGGGQTCDVEGVLKELKKKGFMILRVSDWENACRQALGSTEKPAGAFK